MKTARDNFEFILIDSQAGLDRYQDILIDRSISDAVIIVSEYDPLSAAGVERLKMRSGGNLSYERTWILINKMLPEYTSSFRSFYEVTKYLTPIAWNAEVVRSYVCKKLPLDLEMGNVFTLSIMDCLRAVFSGGVEEELEGWIKEKSELFRAPIRRQIEHIEALINGVEGKIESRSSALLVFRNVTISGFFAAAIVGALAVSKIWGDSSSIFYLFFLTTIFTGTIIFLSKKTEWMADKETTDMIETKKGLEKRLENYKILLESDIRSAIEEKSNCEYICKGELE